MCRQKEELFRALLEKALRSAYIDLYVSKELFALPTQTKPTQTHVSPYTDVRPTQSLMYVPLQVNRCQKCILLIVEYKIIFRRFLFSRI